MLTPRLPLASGLHGATGRGEAKATNENTNERLRGTLEQTGQKEGKVGNGNALCYCCAESSLVWNGNHTEIERPATEERNRIVARALRRSGFLLLIEAGMREQMLFIANCGFVTIGGPVEVISRSRSKGAVDGAG